jgi:starch phosphorylase
MSGIWSSTGSLIRTSYCETDERLDILYGTPAAWGRKAILNVGSSGKFSSDRTIAEYASQIWKAVPCPPK